MKRTLFKQLVMVLIIAIMLPSTGITEGLVSGDGEDKSIGVSQGILTEGESIQEQEQEVSTDFEDAVIEEQEVSLDDLVEEIEDTTSPDIVDNPTDEAVTMAFDQKVIIDDVTIRVLGVQGSFPEGAALQVEKCTDEEIIHGFEHAISIEYTYRHNLYRIAVMDAAGNGVYQWVGSNG